MPKETIKLDLADRTNLQILDAIRVLSPYYRTNNVLFTFNKARLKQTLIESIEEYEPYFAEKENAKIKELQKQIKTLEEELKAIEHEKQRKANYNSRFKMPKNELLDVLRTIQRTLNAKAKSSGTGVKPKAIEKQVAALGIAISFINKNYEV